MANRVRADSSSNRHRVREVHELEVTPMTGHDPRKKARFFEKSIDFAARGNFAACPTTFSG